MIRRILTWMLASTVAAASIDHASAWNDTGHQIVALLAYQALDAGTQKKIQEILADHPHFDEYLAKKLPAGATRSEGIAMHAATWSDWIRSNHTKQFHQGTWHYINIPYIVVEEGDTKTRDAIEAAFSDPKRNRGDILRIIPESRDIIKKPATTEQERKERALRLCWLFHLVGDLHQPMHAVALCTKQLPNGDLGGNLLWIVPTKGQSPKRLHAQWDDMLGSHEDVTGIVRDIQEKVKVSDENRQITDPKLWADESTKLAKLHAYNFKGKAIDFVIDSSFRGPASAPELPDGYLAAGEEIARQRVALGGARLADLLKAALAP